VKPQRLRKRDGGVRVPSQAGNTIRNRITWIIVSAVVAVTIVAGLDAIRSPEKETPPPMTTREQADDALPRCTQEQISVAIEIRRPLPEEEPFRQPLPEEESLIRRTAPVVVVRNVGATSCRHGPFAVSAEIKDRAKRQILTWTTPLGFRDLPSGSEETFFFPTVDCEVRGPFLALAAVGGHSSRRDYSARRENISRSEIGC
jgi:hypothetical protein